MSNGAKFGIIATVVIAIVLLGYYLSEYQKAKMVADTVDPTKETPPSMEGKTFVRAPELAVQ